ncbi:hypothetical protein AAFF_G00157950 [Aldrovandia affinis]|uniref:Uncharacterized protein n=1 Tax=Aldrovandia affinis TaxID=143900 RepID=A0AAD7W902_9TELE|nr:hypothetical protein AAFF_G00157950 [Aldrovandia affinis]
MAMDSSSTSPPVLFYHNDGDYYPRSLGPKPDVVPSGVTERKVGPLDKPDMVAVDVINIKEPDFPVYRRKQETDTYVLGTIHPFRKTQRSFFGKFTQEFLLVASDRRSWKILLFGGLNLICIGCLLMWGHSTNSMARCQTGCESTTGLSRAGRGRRPYRIEPQWLMQNGIRTSIFPPEQPGSAPARP